MSNSQTQTSHIAPMITQEMARESEAATRENRQHLRSSPMARAHNLIYGALLQAHQEYGADALKVPLWQIMHAHVLLGGRETKGGSMRINTQFEWTRRDCPHAMIMAFDAALTDGSRLFPLAATTLLRSVPNQHYMARQNHHSTYGRYAFGAVAVKNGKAHPEDRPIVGIILFDERGRVLLAEGNIAATVARIAPSDAVKDISATCLFSRLPFFVKNQDEDTRDAVAEHYRMCQANDWFNPTMGFELGQTWNSAIVEEFVPAPTEQAIAPVAKVEPVAEATSDRQLVEQTMQKVEQREVVLDVVADAPAPAVEPVAEEEDFDSTGLQSQHERGVAPIEPVLQPKAEVTAAPAAVVNAEPEVDDLFAELTPEQEFARAKNDIMARLKIATTKVAACTRELAKEGNGSTAVVFITRLEKATEEVNAIKAEAAALKAKYGKGA